MKPNRRRWWGLGILSLGVALIIVDSTIVNVSIPSIIDDIGISSTEAQWIQEIYTLVFAALLLVFGRIADHVGRRRVFITGVALFTFASVLAALAPSGVLLIGARGLQGLGGAMMLPTSLSLLNAGFRGRDRAIAFGVWGATIGGMAAIGPLLGGWLTSSFSWRWAFGINIPIGVLVITGLLAFVPESREPDSRPGMDLPGAALSVLGFGGVVFGLIEGRVYGWWTTQTPLRIRGWTWPWQISVIPVAFALGAACLAMLIVVQARRNALGKVSMLNLGLFKIPSFRNGNIAAAIVSLGEFGLIFALPLWLQNVAGYTAFRTGVVLLALAGGSFVASAMVAPLSTRFGPVTVVRLGILLELVGLAGLGLLLTPTATWRTIAPMLAVYGIGVGFATAQLTGVVLADVPVSESGQGSGTQSTARQVGSAFGIAILGTVLFGVLGANLDSALSHDGMPDTPRGQVVTAVKQSAGAVIPQLASAPPTARVAERAKEAFTDATKASAFTAAGFLLAGLIATATLRNPARSRTGDGNLEQINNPYPEGAQP